MTERIEQITTPDVAEPPGNIFSQCLRVGNRLYLAGQTAASAEGAVGGDDTGAQARECFRRIKLLVEAGGGTLADVVKLTIYLTDMADRPKLTEARKEFFSGRMPCSTLLGVSALADPAYKVEVDAEVWIGAGS